MFQKETTRAKYSAARVLPPHSSIIYPESITDFCFFFFFNYDNKIIFLRLLINFFLPFSGLAVSRFKINSLAIDSTIGNRHFLTSVPCCYLTSRVYCWSRIQKVWISKKKHNRSSVILIHWQQSRDIHNLQFPSRHL